jgi:hypothetical protein
MLLTALHFVWRGSSEQPVSALYDGDLLYKVAIIQLKHSFQSMVWRHWVESCEDVYIRKIFALI